MERQLIPCACGCGKSIQNFNRDGKPLRYAVGHNWTPELAKLGAAASVASPKARQARSDAGKKSWKDPAYRERMAASVQRQWADPVFKEKVLSAAKAGSKRKWLEDSEFRAKMVERGRRASEHLLTPEVRTRNRQAVSRRFRELWKMPEWIAKIKITHANQCGTVRVSKPEQRLRAALTTAGESFLTNHRFVLSRGYTMPDAYIPALNLAVFTDGRYWHGKPKKKQRDHEQRTELMGMGVNVFVIDQGKPETSQFDLLMKTIAELKDRST